MAKSIPKIQRVTAKAVIMNVDGKILLVKESDRDKRWEFPGGKIEFGDTPEETLVRELKEETGLTSELEIGKIINSWTWVFEFDRAHLQFFMLAYLCKTAQKEFILSPEHVEYGWFLKEDALKLDITEGTRETVKIL
ncbi:MAG: NUDIX hydrolase [Parcubacteria group bacterium]|jgi:mutator protein MutT